MERLPMTAAGYARLEKELKELKELKEDDDEREEVVLFDWETPDYFKSSHRFHQFDPFSTTKSFKPSLTAKNVKPFDIDLFDGQEIVVDFITDRPVWENKTLKFDYQKNLYIHLKVITIAIKNSSEHVFCFSTPQWQICDPQSTVGWIDEVSLVLSKAKQIWMFDPDLFYGVMRFYQPQEQVMMPWRLKTKGLCSVLRKKYRCWKQISTLCDLNRIVCPNAFHVAELEREGSYQGVVRAMKSRVSCLTTLFRIATSVGIVIPVAKSRKRKRSENTEETSQEPQEQTVVISYDFN